MNIAVAIPSFLASSVEFVEALTIVLAIGVTRGWKSPILGAIAASVLLLAITVAFGATLTQLVPISVLRVVVGVLILLFGLKWLRKAVLRFTGLKATHDEAQIYREEVSLATAQARVAAGQMDWFGFVASFKAVALEGLEVAFIVIALGATARALGSAAVGAAAAGIIVVGAGLAVAQPLSRVPENLLKFVVGLMLTSFGTFWTAEGFGADWWHPGALPADFSLIPVFLGYLAVSLCLIAALRRLAEQDEQQIGSPSTPAVQR